MADAHLERFCSGRVINARDVRDVRRLYLSGMCEVDGQWIWRKAGACTDGYL